MLNLAVYLIYFHSLEPQSSSNIAFIAHNTPANSSISFTAM